METGELIGGLWEMGEMTSQSELGGGDGGKRIEEDGGRVEQEAIV